MIDSNMTDYNVNIVQYIHAASQGCTTNGSIWQGCYSIQALYTSIHHILKIMYPVQYIMLETAING